MCIRDSTYSVDFNIRVIKMADYPDILTLEEFVGFLYGMAAGNHDIEALPMGISFWRSFTHWIGGMGVLVFVMMITSLDDENAMPLLSLIHI